MVVALDAPVAVEMRPHKGSANIAASEALSQIPALTGLRFFAAFSILFAHAVDWLAQFQDSSVMTKFSFVAMYGMPLFFVLSGFVIHYNYRRLFLTQGIARATCEFAAARFARIYPLYLFLLLVAVFADDFVGKVYNRADLFFSVLGYYITLTQSWWYIVYDKWSIITWLFSLSWSISTEMFFYAAYVAVIPLVLFLRGVRAAMIVAVGFAVIVTLLLLASRYYLSEVLSLAQRHISDYIDLGAAFEHSFYRWLFYFSPYFRVLEFFLGCLTAHVFMLLRHRPVSKFEQRCANIGLVATLSGLASLGAVYLGVGNFATLNSYVQHLALNFLCAPAIAFILFYVGRYDTIFTKFLSSPALVRLGDTSYSIYLIHTWTLRVFTRPAPVLNWIWGADAAFRVLLAIVFTLLAAYATYHLIEVPSRNWFRRKLGHAIAVGFGSERSVVATNPTLAPRSRVIFSSAAISLLILVAIAGQVARSDTVWSRVHRLWFGGRPEITIVSATYGLNCKNFPVPAPFPNAVAYGNATQPVERVCNLRQRCDFTVDSSSIGDPANGCGKDFSFEYRCTGSDDIKSAFIAAEATGKRATLDCSTGFRK